MREKIKVGILFSGKSAEHEVSLQSAKNVIDAIDKEKYQPVLIGIDKSGKWYLNDQSSFLLNADNPSLIALNKASNKVTLVPQEDGKLMSLTESDTTSQVDVVFPILHGPFGEDGTVQGLLKLANIPFVGASVLGSAIAIDKDVMNCLLRDAGLPIAKFISLYSHDSIPSYQKLTDELGTPLFIKPSNLGSSVGVSKVNKEEDFESAIKSAFEYDNKILIEEFIKGREIECAVLGNENPIASVPGEVIPTDDFYSYTAKYIDEKGAVLEIPAKLDEVTIKRVQKLAIATFKTLSCEGLARVDFFLTDQNEVIVNELNSIPGFTSSSMYPMLWQESGISYTELIDRLIQLAIERFEKEKKLKTSY